MKVKDNEWSLERLLTQLRKGDQKAFEFIVHTHTPNLFQRAFKLTNDRENAKDLVQEVFADLWTRRERLYIESSVGAYLQTMLKSKFLKMLSRGQLHERAVEHLLIHMDKMQHSVIDMLAFADLQHSLSKVVDRLPVNMQKIFMLRADDFSLKEIAQALGLAEQTVKSYHAELSRHIRSEIWDKHPEIRDQVPKPDGSNLKSEV